MGVVKVVVLVIFWIVNFDDFDFLWMELNVSLELIFVGMLLLGDVDLVLLLGLKFIVGDLVFFWGQGWDVDFQVYVWCGGYVLGICGGYQMLGKMIFDLDGIEGVVGIMEGFGLLDVEIVLMFDKVFVEVCGMYVVMGVFVLGYEIYIGWMFGVDCSCFYFCIVDIDGLLKLDGV